MKWSARFFFLQQESYRPANNSSLGKWFTQQNRYFKLKLRTMRDGDPRRNLWAEFIRTHSDWFDDKKPVVKVDWNTFFKAMHMWSRRPSKKGAHPTEQRLATWIDRQHHLYLYKKDEMMEGMLHRELWSDFVNSHPTWFNRTMNEWNETFHVVKQWSFRPSVTASDPTEKQLGCWVARQQIHYRDKSGKMKKGSPQRKIWRDFRSTRPTWFPGDIEKWRLFDQLVDLQSNGEVHPFFL